MMELEIPSWIWKPCFLEGLPHTLAQVGPLKIFEEPQDSEWLLDLGLDFLIFLKDLRHIGISHLVIAGMSSSISVMADNCNKLSMFYSAASIVEGQTQLAVSVYKEKILQENLSTKNVCMYLLCKNNLFNI